MSIVTMGPEGLESLGEKLKCPRRDQEDDDAYRLRLYAAGRICGVCQGRNGQHHLVPGVDAPAGATSNRSSGFVPCPLSDPHMELVALRRENAELGLRLTAVQDRCSQLEMARRAAVRDLELEKEHIAAARDALTLAMRRVGELERDRTDFSTHFTPDVRR